MSYDFSADWFSKNTATWAEIFSEVIPGTKRLLEIGSYEGRSTVWLIENVLAKGGSIHCVDTWEGGIDYNGVRMDAVERRFDANVKAALKKAKKARLTKLKGNSATLLCELIASGMAGVFDFVYVDGCHQAPDVLTDIVHAFHLCRAGGVIACDDYLWKQEEHLTYSPRLAIDSFAHCFHGKVRILQAPLYQLYFQKL